MSFYADVHVYSDASLWLLNEIAVKALKEVGEL